MRLVRKPSPTNRTEPTYWRMMSSALQTLLYNNLARTQKYGVGKPESSIMETLSNLIKSNTLVWYLN